MRCLEHILQASRVEMIVSLRRQAARWRCHQVDDAFHLMASHHVEHLIRVGHIQARREDACADLVFEEVRYTVRAVLGNDHLFPNLQETHGRIQPNKPHAADDQNHPVALRGMSSIIDHPCADAPYFYQACSMASRATVRG